MSLVTSIPVLFLVMLLILIVPISRELDNVTGDALWFSVQNSSDYSQEKEFTVPNNIYRTMLEVFVLFHQNDEFWYGNPLNDYILANSLSNPRNGHFREVIVSLDGAAVGVVWPFTMIFTNGINPLLLIIEDTRLFYVPHVQAALNLVMDVLLAEKSKKVLMECDDSHILPYFIGNSHFHNWCNQSSHWIVKAQFHKYKTLVLIIMLRNFQPNCGSFLPLLVITVPSAFQTIDSMHFVSSFEPKLSNVKGSLQSRELACEELKSNGLFVKLLEVVLKAGNRLNVGTAKGGARVFNPSTLRKRSDVNSADGKTILLHFVVHELVRIEGKKCALLKHELTSEMQGEERDQEYMKLGLYIIKGLRVQLGNVKKAASVDYES